MLSQETKDIIHSTAPVLKNDGQAITQLFYTKLFAAHPELQNIFNRVNQAKGEQSRALADAVFMYATHIHALEKLGPLVSRTAHKHASLQVAPEHYPIVGKFLLEAIQEHLQLDAEDPILKAWAEAYAVLADIFITTEETIYAENEKKTGGWRGFRRFVIHHIKEECKDVKSLFLEPEDQQAIADFEPGQYLGLRVQVAGQKYTAIRQYSIVNPPGEKHYRIMVKAEEMKPGQPGEVSHFLHRAQAGDTLELMPPTGDFKLKTARHNLSLIAGGVGITPLLCMLLTQIKQKQNLSRWTFIQCCRSAEHAILDETLRALSREHGFRYILSLDRGEEGEHQGYLNEGALSEFLTYRDSDVYFCGPLPFMQFLNQSLQNIGFTKAQLHYETFGPSIDL